MNNNSQIRLFVLVFFATIVMFVSAGCDELESSAPLSSVSKSAGVSVSQTHISEDQEFSIMLPAGHPQKMAIFTPNSRFYILHSQEQGISLWDGSEPAEAKTVKINPRTLAGVTWLEGVRTSALVFRAKGVYRFYLADNLETEPENSNSRSIEVTYN